MRTGVLSLSLFLFAAFLPSPSFGEELVGPLSREALLAANPEWQAVAAAYQPKPDCLDRLRACGREVRIEVFLGTWCSDSKAHVSELFKVLEMADSPLIRVVLIGVPEAKDEREPYYGGRDIVRLPTFLILADGREIGRIVETPERSVEEDLLLILGL
ncbi:MAG: thioredoxin family protein [Candidatus Moduliflexus flocculans]|nr:thioredoxin family protein [Candidatus Moduliflexus flocculans]